MTASFDLDTLLQSIIETCTRLSNASRGSLFLYNEESIELIMRAEKGNAPELRFNARYSIDRSQGIKNIGLTAYIYLQKEALVLNSPEEIIDHQAHKGKYDDQQYPGKEKCQSLVGIPLINPSNKESMGVLKIENTVDRKPSIKFTESEIDVFKIMADIASASIVRFQNQLIRINTSITKLSNAVKGTESLTDKLRNIASIFKEITHADGASIWIINGTRLICKGGVGHYQMMEDEAFYDLSFEPKTAKKIGLTAWIGKVGDFVNIKSYQELMSHPQHKGTYDYQNYPSRNNKKCESFIGAPLKIGNKIIGVIKADYRIPDKDHKENYFTQEEAQIFSYLALVTAIVVENHQDYERAMTHDKIIINLYKIGAECSNMDSSTQIYWNLLVGLTHNDGIGFNRAIIFDLHSDGIMYLEGKMAVGPFNYQEGIDFQKSLDSGKITSHLQDCLNEFGRNCLFPPSTKLQDYVVEKLISIDKDCIVMSLGLSKDYSVLMKIVPISAFCENMQLFLTNIDSNKINDKILLFSIRNTEGQSIIGLCDYVYSNKYIDEFISHATEIFLHQILLAISRLSLKKTEEEARERAWREFSAPTAHRIGTEIADMSGALRWIEIEINDSDALSEYFLRLRSSLKRIGSAVDEYIELARPPELKLEYLNVNDLLNESLDAFKDNNLITLDINISEDLPVVEGDKERLLYAFKELYYNAFKEMENGGILYISADYNELSNTILIEIANSGKGIPENIIEKIFDFGYKGRPRGTGIGLYIVKKDLEVLKGSIKVINNDKGVSFQISLPACNKKRFIFKRILIVEDTPNRRFDINKIIQQKYPFITILEATNEDAAINLIREEKFDYIITDIALDEGGGTVFGGIRILEAINQMDISVKTIVITAHRGFSYFEKDGKKKSVFDKAKELGAYDCLSVNDEFFDNIMSSIDKLL